MPFFRGLQDAQQRVVRQRWVFTQGEHCRWHPFFTRARGTKCFIPQLKCFPCAPCAQCMAIITMAPYSIIMPTPNNTLVLMPALHRAHASLSWASPISLHAPHEWNHYLRMWLAMWHWLSPWETLVSKKKKKTKQTEQGELGEATAAKPWICLSAHFVSAFVLAGSGAMVKSCSLQRTGEESQRAEPYFRLTTDVMTAILDNGGRKH